MKLLLTVLLSAFSLQPSAFSQVFNFPAQGPTTAQFLSVSNAVGTNVVNLNGAQTITGTKTFPTSLFTANGIGRRLLWASPTNSYVASFAATASVLTNSGDYALGTPIYTATLPALLSTNSYVLITSMPSVRTNSNTTAANIAIYAGTNTNCLVYFSGSIAATVGAARLQSEVFKNDGSHTSQRANPSGAGGLLYVYPSNFVGSTASPWTIYISGWTLTSCTNVLFTGLYIEEIVSP